MNQTAATLYSMQDDSRCRFWKLGPERASGGAEAGEDRRRGDRRGKGVRIFRFSNDRRLPQDRRGQIGRFFERAPLVVEGELRHRGVNHPVRTANLSERGAALVDAPLLPVGSTVRLTLRPADDLEEYPLVLWAQVGSFCPETGLLGVRFASPRPCDSKRLLRLVACARQDGGPPAPYTF